jgi:sushi domain-containing protein 2
MIMCIVCVVYQYRKKQLEKDPNYVLPIPHSRSGSRTTLKHPSELSDDDHSIRKVRRYDGSYETHEPLKDKPAVDFDAKKMDLDEEDFTSSEGTSSFRDVKSKDFEYGNMIEAGSGQDQRQLGRRNQQQRLASEYKPIEEEDNRYPPPPIESPPPQSYNGTYSPTFSNLDRASFLSDPNQSPTPVGGVRVMPLNTPQKPAPLPPSSSKFYPEASRSPTLSQNVGVPQPSDGRSTQV